MFNGSLLDPWWQADHPKFSSRPAFRETSEQLVILTLLSSFVYVWLCQAPAAKSDARGPAASDDCV